MCQVQLAVTQPTQCTIGNSIDTSSPVNSQLFVLNVKEPALCSGAVTSFQFCFTSFANESNQSFFVVALYRENGDSSYSTVSRSFTIPQVVAEQKCKEVALFPPISVKEGDVLGACLKNTENTTLLGNDTNLNTTAFLLTSDTDICNGSIPQSIQKSSLTNTNGLVLQFSATVSSNSSALQVGEIVGIVLSLVGLVIFIAIIVKIVIYCRCKSQRRSPYASTEPLLPQNSAFGKLIPNNN